MLLGGGAPPRPGSPPGYPLNSTNNTVQNPEHPAGRGECLPSLPDWEEQLLLGGGALRQHPLRPLPRRIRLRRHRDAGDPGPLPRPLLHLPVQDTSGVVRRVACLGRPVPDRVLALLDDIRHRRRPRREALHSGPALHHQLDRVDRGLLRVLLELDLEPRLPSLLEPFQRLRWLDGEGAGPPLPYPHAHMDVREAGGLVCECDGADLTGVDGRLLRRLLPHGQTPMEEVSPRSLLPDRPGRLQPVVRDLLPRPRQEPPLHAQDVHPHRGLRLHTVDVRHLQGQAEPAGGSAETATHRGHSDNDRRRLLRPFHPSVQPVSGGHTPLFHGRR